MSRLIGYNNCVNDRCIFILLQVVIYTVTSACRINCIPGPHIATLLDQYAAMIVNIVANTTKLKWTVNTLCDE